MNTPIYSHTFCFLSVTGVTFLLLLFLSFLLILILLSFCFLPFQASHFLLLLQSFFYISDPLASTYILLSSIICWRRTVSIIYYVFCLSLLLFLCVHLFCYICMETFHFYHKTLMFYLISL